MHGMSGGFSPSLKQESVSQIYINGSKLRAGACQGWKILKITLIGFQHFEMEDIHFLLA